MAMEIANVCPLYLAAGWELIPLPAGVKAPLPAGLIGYGGRPAPASKIYQWLEKGFRAKDPDGKLKVFPVGALALRLPRNVIGIDVDHYEGKPGGDSLTMMESKWGPLPEGPLTTSRREKGDLISGIRLFRIREGLSWQANPEPGIDIITWYHRFAVVWPSIHKSGAMYRWYGSGGMLRERVPEIIQCPELPAAWQQGLSRGAQKPASSHLARPDDVQVFLAAHTAELYPGAWQGLRQWLADGVLAGKGRHDRGKAALRRAMEESSAGAYSAQAAIDGIREKWLEFVADRGRAAEGEWDRIVSYAVSRALSMSDQDREAVAAKLLDRNGHPVTDDEKDDLSSITHSNKKQKSEAVNNVVPAPGLPMNVAREFVKLTLFRGVATIVSWRGDFYRWDGSQWNEADPKIIRDEIYHWLESARYWKVNATKTQPKLKPALEAWAPNITTVSRVADALSSAVTLPWETEPGEWLDLTGSRFTNKGKPSFKSENGRVVPDGSSASLLSVPTPVIALSTALLDIKTRILYPCNPSFFCLSTINFFHPYLIEGGSGTAGTTLEFDCPEWKLFLKSVWPDDEDSIRLLRQWFGYAISGDTSRQKIMLMVGPKRSGKGTIGRVLRALMTARNVASPTTESLKDRFGLSSLIGKSLAIISDARFEGYGVQTAVERLLAISGEDAIDVDRKNRPIWNGRLGTRFMIMSNKVPALLDSSGAIASRFLVLQLTSSWLGREDRELESRLMAELPGILFWALDGMSELEGAAQFAAPESAAEAHESMEGLSSPHSTFVSEMCNCDETESVPCSDLYQAWCRWCERNGRRDAGNSAVFGRDLRAAIPGISRRNPRVPGSRIWVYQGLSFKEDTDDEGALPTARDMKRKL